METIDYRKTPLIVIDMQEDYYSAARRKGVLKAVKREIKDAKERNALIIFVEFPQYEDSARTYKSLTNITKNYYKCMFVFKDGPDGSNDIVEFCLENDIDLSRFKHIRVCGVEANCCVEETVRGLMEYYQNDNVIFHVIEDAVANPDFSVQWEYIEGQQGKSQIKRKRINKGYLSKVG